MSLTIASVATAAASTTTATLTSAAFSADVGDFLLVFVAADNAGADGATSLQSSASDTAGNTYTNRVLTTYDPGLVSQGTTLGVWTAPVTAAVSSGTISVSFSPSTRVKVMRVMRARPAPGYAAVYGAVGTSSTGGSSLGPSKAIGEVTEGRTVFGVASITSDGFFGILGYDEDTTAGSWSSGLAVSRSASSPTKIQVVATQYKTVTATASQTWGVVTTGTDGWAANYVIVYAEAIPNASVSVVGLSAEAQLGTPTALAVSDATPTGVSATAAAGYAVFPAYPEGVEAQAELGAPTLVSGISVPTTGVQAQAETGQLVTASETIFASGVSAAAELGSPTTWVVFLTFAQGVEATAQVSSAQAWSYVVDSQASSWTPVIN